MKRAPLPYAMPNDLDPTLKQVLAYWDGLRRHENNIPFWDDVRILSLPDLADSLMLIDVFAKPPRFRLNAVGRRLIERYGDPVAGKFIDEVEAKPPFAYLLSQCSATVESGTPTFFKHDPGKAGKSAGAAPYARLILPLWGDGHIGMLLGALHFD